MNKLPLEDIKVIAFEWVATGPITTKYLSDFGAEVIKIESSRRVDLVRSTEVAKGPKGSPDGSGLFIHFNTGKYSMCLNLADPKGIEIAKRLSKWADVVVENFRPGVMDRLGLGYEVLRKIKEDIIMISLSIGGRGGKYEKLAAYGYMGAALSGHYHLTGWPDREPTQCGAIALADVVAPLSAVVAILGALENKRKTGNGCYIDISQLEVMVQLIGHAMLDFTINGNPGCRMGNRHPYASPHGVFRCKGDDKWCAISVFTETEWTNFCNVINKPELLNDKRFANLSSRKENENKLEQLVENWTINYSPQEVMLRMQSEGVPAAAVQDADDLVDNCPHLKDRESFLKLSHPVVGVCNHPAPPIKLSKTPAKLGTAPLLGQHTEYVCTQILELSDDEFLELFQSGVLE